MKPVVIAFAGKRHSGKSEAVRVLNEEFGFREIKFAGPLKDMLRAMYRSVGVDDETIERKIEGDLKEVPCEWLMGATPRRAMQTLGTEWRDGLVPELDKNGEPMSRPLWAAMFVMAVNSGNLGPRLACSDYRFPHEGVALDAVDAHTVLIHRTAAAYATDEAAQHISETSIDKLPVHATLYNDGTLEDLRQNVRVLANSVLSK